MRRDISRMPEDALEEWLDQGTAADFIFLARSCRNRLVAIVSECRHAGDDTTANRIIKECARLFAPNLVWP